MHIKSQNISCLLLTIFIILVLSLASCSTTDPTTTPLPMAAASATVMLTPEPATATPQPAYDENSNGILLPSATPFPTATPGVITELVSQFSENTGLQDKTVFWLSGEDWLNLGISILLVVIIGLLLSRLVYYALAKAVARTEIQQDDAFIKLIRRQISVVFIVIGFQVGTLRLPFINISTKQWLNQLYIAIYVVAITIILWHLLDSLVKWYQEDVEPQRDQNQSDTILILLHRIARVFLITISGIVLLSLYNINVNALIAALGVGGLAISLAAQDTLSNIISGIMIMIDQPFRVGDRIEIQGLGTWGDVVDIGLRSTRIRTLDNRLVVIPNNSISSDQIVNYTYPDPQYRIQIEIGIGYNQDIEKVRQLIIDTVRKVDGVLQDKPIDALYIEMGPSAMTFRIRWWIESFVDTRRMFDRVNTALQMALSEAGVAKPFNTIDINILELPGTGQQSLPKVNEEPNDNHAQIVE